MVTRGTNVTNSDKYRICYKLVSFVVLAYDLVQFQRSRSGHTHFDCKYIGNGEGDTWTFTIEWHNKHAYTGDSLRLACHTPCSCFCYQCISPPLRPLTTAIQRRASVCPVCIESPGQTWKTVKTRQMHLTYARVTEGKSTKQLNPAASVRQSVTSAEWDEENQPRSTVLTVLIDCKS